MCICVHVHVIIMCVCACVHLCARACDHLNMCVCVCVCGTCVHLCMGHARMHVYALHAHICVWCMSLCMCAHMYPHACCSQTTEREALKQPAAHLSPTHILPLTRAPSTGCCSLVPPTHSAAHLCPQLQSALRQGLAGPRASAAAAAAAEAQTALAHALHSPPLKVMLLDNMYPLVSGWTQGQAP